MWESDLIHPINHGALRGWEPYSCTVESWVRWELAAPDREDTASLLIGYLLDLHSPTGHVETVDLDALLPRQRQRLGSFIGRPIEDARAGTSGRLTVDFTGGWRMDVRHPGMERHQSHTFWNLTWQDGAGIGGHFTDGISIAEAPSRWDEDDEE